VSTSSRHCSPCRAHASILAPRAARASCSSPNAPTAAVWTPEGERDQREVGGLKIIRIGSVEKRHQMGEHNGNERLWSVLWREEGAGITRIMQEEQRQALTHLLGQGGGEGGVVALLVVGFHRQRVQLHMHLYETQRSGQR